MTTLPPLPREIDGSLDEAAKALSGLDRVAIGCHLAPDGDALGSVLGLALGLESLGTSSHVGWGDERWLIPGQYTFLPALDRIGTPDAFTAAEVGIAVDCATAERLGVIRDRVLDADVVVNIDHHVSNTRFGTIDVVDTEAPSSSELVLHLLLRMGAEITPDIATLLYTGLFTDTGQFSYATATPRAHAAAALLIEAGVVVEKVSQAVFESQPFGYLKVLGRALERCRLLESPPLVISYLTQEDLQTLGVELEDTEEVINVLRSTGNADVSAILKQLPSKHWKGSLRSKGAYDVSAIAQDFGGGGHRLAAGFTSTLELEATIERIHTLLREAGDGTGEG